MILGALPVPVVLLDAENRFRYVNHAAEQFLGVSAGQLASAAPDRPRAVRQSVVPAGRPGAAGEATSSDHEMTLESPRLHKPGITVQCSPLPEEQGAVLLVLQDASAARSLDRQLAFRSAARCVTGMAADAGARGEEPAIGHSRRRAVAGSLRRRRQIANWPC